MYHVTYKIEIFKFTKWCLYVNDDGERCHAQLKMYCIFTNLLNC